MLRYLTAGESHGRALLALVDGFPAGVELNIEAINAELARVSPAATEAVERDQLPKLRRDPRTGVYRPE